MNSLRKKIKRGAISCLALTMCTTLAAGTALMNFKGSSPFAAAETAAEVPSDSVKFTNVTGQYDTSSLVKQNFSPDVVKSDGANYETRTVIVRLDGNSLTDDADDGVTVSDYLNSPLGRQSLRRINGEQSKFLNALSLSGIKYTFRYSYTAVANAVAIEIDTANVAKIKQMGGVESAVISRTHAAPKTVSSRTSASSIVNDANVYKTGIYDSSAVAGYDWGTGAGTVVAVLDTGLDYTHPAFQTMPSKLGMDRDYIEGKLGATNAFGHITAMGGTINIDDVYLNDKIPFAYDYADDDFDVYPSYSNHGAHVAGIVGGYNADGYVDKDGNKIDEAFRGVATEAQLVICKTFTDDLESKDLGGAVTEDVLAALEDCVVLGVDVINMSLGSTSGFTSTDDGDDEGELIDKIYSSVQENGISLICAASNEYSAGAGSIFGTNLATNPDSGTVGSPSTYFSALSVGSISGQKSPYMLAGDGTEDNEFPIFYENSRDGNSVEYEFDKEMLRHDPVGTTKKTFEYVVVGKGEGSDYSSATVRNLLQGRIALIERGNNTFLEKVKLAAEMGAIGAIIYNNVSGIIRMNLGDLEPDLDPALPKKAQRIPATSITMDAGKELVRRAAGGQSRRVGKITIDTSLEAGPFMSEFSAWGTTPDLKLKPEITAHGGEITSTVPGGYDEQSGTSMASPNMAGLTALVRNYVKSILPDNAPATEVTRLTNQLILSTASTVNDQFGEPYSPRKQGAGLANLKNIVSTGAYLFTDSDCGSYWYDELDGRPKIELGADKAKSGKYTFSFKIKNFKDASLTFGLDALVMTETLSSDNLAAAEQAYMLGSRNEKGEGIAPVFSGDGVSGGKLTVAGGATAKVTVTVELSDKEKQYLENSFKNGMFVEGFIKLLGDESGQCDLSIPFITFYGDWENLPMLDYDAFEIADSKRDSSVKEEDKLQPTIFATQAYASYGNEKFVIPIGNYVYLQDENDVDQLYTDEEHGAISRFNVFTSDDGIGNYYTANDIKCLYAGLLRNARKVEWRLYDAYTGELMRTDTNYRISKAYANGGSAIPGFVKLELTPDELGLVNNGKYRFEFDFLFNEKSVASEENSFKFSFYVDYDAPVLQDARLRYEDYKDGNKIRQNIYLDLDIYDNHYAQSVMFAYLDTMGERRELKLATDYFVPVKNAVKNGITTVSIDVTDIWTDEYRDKFVVQIDDYALNHATYVLGSMNGTSTGETNIALNKNVTPDKFELAEGEEQITLGVNETHKVALLYEGDANLSNFSWVSDDRSKVLVKNGELFGVAETGRVDARVTVGNHKGVSKTIRIKVVDNGVKLGSPSGISFGIIRNADDSLVNARGSVRVNAGEDIKLSVNIDPWYYPSNNLKLTWSSGNPTSATVDQNGNVHTITKGKAVISAMASNGQSANVELDVQDEFTVSNLSLTAYHGDGVDGVVTIPSDKNVMSIGEQAFLDNKKITKVIIPKTVTSISERAFEGCSNLREVYFINDEDADYTAPDFVADADLKLIGKYAFKGCESLELLDFRNLKVISVATEAFANCTKLRTIIKSSAIGTAYDRAFMGCSALESVDLSGLHVAGRNVFSGCTSLGSITTDKFSAIGEGMFAPLSYRYNVFDYDTGTWATHTTEYPACTSLESAVIKTSLIGAGAFEGCTNLKSVEFSNIIGAGADTSIVFRIGDRAFKDCAKLSSVAFNGSVKSIGAQAFANTALTSVTLPDGLVSLGAGAFGGTNLPTFVGGGDFTVSGDFILSKDGKILLLYIGTAATCTIPASVTEISANAFAESPITSITIPATVEKIGEGAFRNSSLSTVTVNANLAEIPAYCFFGTPVSTVTLPASVTYIGDYAFGNSDLTEFNFAPANGAELGSFVFSGCKKLVEISLNDKITAMGDVTFGGCTLLETAHLPALVSLGSYTFDNTPALKTVTFAAGAKVTGTYTFAASSAAGRENLTSVTLGASLTKIGEGAFLNCANLKSINLNGAETVGNGAFGGCTSLATVTGLESVKSIGALAFANCNALKTLNLANAEIIGDGAFMIENDGAAYTSVSIPKAKEVGARAFHGGAETTVEIPATLQSIGGGAFAASVNLVSFTVGGGNVYFVEGGVLYRYISDTSYEIVAYPSGLTAQVLKDDFADNKKTYKVKEGTVAVAEASFDGLKDGAIEHVVLPYTLKTVGSGAFYDSGISEYRFESINAPALLTQYESFVDEYIDAHGGTYVGFFYTNFEDYFLFHTDYAQSARPASLKLYRPENGVGYDNTIFSRYFSESAATGINIDDTTREVRDMILGLPAASEVSGWTESSKPKSEVEEFSEHVKNIRATYNLITEQSQLDILGEENIKHLSDVEVSLRAVKTRYGIPVTITSVSRIDGTYKDTYYEGQKFDMRGLKVIVTYDDYSTETVGSDKLKLVDDRPLTYYDQSVAVSYNGVECYLVITVREGSAPAPAKGGCNNVSDSTDTLLISFAGLGAMLMLAVVVRRKKRITNV